jgi:hypothetical protein
MGYLSATKADREQGLRLTTQQIIDHLNQNNQGRDHLTGVCVSLAVGRRCMRADESLSHSKNV